MEQNINRTNAKYKEDQIQHGTKYKKNNIQDAKTIQTKGLGNVRETMTYKTLMMLYLLKSSVN